MASSPRSVPPREAGTRPRRPQRESRAKNKRRLDCASRLLSQREGWISPVFPVSPSGFRRPTPFCLRARPPVGARRDLSRGHAALTRPGAAAARGRALRSRRRGAQARPARERRRKCSGYRKTACHRRCCRRPGGAIERVVDVGEAGIGMDAVAAGEARERLKPARGAIGKHRAIIGAAA